MGAIIMFAREMVNPVRVTISDCLFFSTSFNVHNAAKYEVSSKRINSAGYIIVMHMYNILFTSDRTLTPENVLAKLQEVQLWERKESSHNLDMPYATHDNLIDRHGDGAPGKSAVVNEYLSNHPYPRWDQINGLLTSKYTIIYSV